MLALAFQLVPLALYAGFAPMAALVCVLLLEPPSPLRRAGAFVAGYGLALVLLGAGGAVLLERRARPLLDALLAGLNLLRSEPHAERDALKVAIGLLLLGLGLWRWRRREARPGALPAWLRAAEGVGPLRAAGLGVVMLVTNLDNVLAYLAAVHIIGNAGLGTPWSLALFLLLTAAGCASVLAPLVIFLSFPAASSGVLAAFETWMGRVSQTAVAIVLIALGAWLILWGAGGLLA